jgi:hypothetical protein
MFNSLITPSKLFSPGLFNSTSTPKKTPPSILKKRRQSPSCSPFRQLGFSPGGLSFSPPSFFMSPLTSSLNRHNGETSSTKRVIRRAPQRTPESSSVRRQLNLDDISADIPLLPSTEALQTDTIGNIFLPFATPTKDSSSSFINTPEEKYSSSEVPTPITTPPVDGNLSLLSLSESISLSTPSPSISNKKKTPLQPSFQTPFSQPASFDDITNSVGFIGLKIGDMKTAYHLKQINQKINNIKEPTSAVDKRPATAMTNSFHHLEAYRRATKIINIGQRKTGYTNFSIGCKESRSAGVELNSSSTNNNDSPFKEVYIKDQEKKENININGIKT